MFDNSSGSAAELARPILRSCWEQPCWPVFQRHLPDAANASYALVGAFVLFGGFYALEKFGPCVFNEAKPAKVQTKSIYTRIRGEW